MLRARGARPRSKSAILIARCPTTKRLQRESSLIATIRKKLPEFAKACADDAELVLLRQDAFAADYQEDECTLLGMAIKYAGLGGKEVREIEKNPQHPRRRGQRPLKSIPPTKDSRVPFVFHALVRIVLPFISGI